jgi:hypothetical protein
MMAKKASARFQTAAEVADALARWLQAHGHTFDTSASSGGSSTRLTAGSSGTRLAQPAGPGSSGAGSSRRLARASTIGGSHVTKGPATAEPSAPAGPGSSVTGSQGALPVARRLEVVDPLAEIAAAANEFAAGRAASVKGVTEEELAAYQKRRKGLPAWAWWALGGGALLAVLLLVLLLTTGQ